MTAARNCVFSSANVGPTRRGVVADDQVRRCDAIAARAARFALEAKLLPNAGAVLVGDVTVRARSGDEEGEEGGITGR
jgi:hypothetical protein